MNKITNIYSGNLLYDKIIDVVLCADSAPIPSIDTIVPDDTGEPRRISLFVYPNKQPSIQGNLYTYKSKEELLKGYRPGTTMLLQPGDAAKISGQNTTYYVENINRDPVVEHEIHIVCPKIGQKPDISLTVSAIPGKVCYKTTLKIRNLAINNTDIRKWSRMSITAGYMNGSQITFESPIFSSFVESPNPDGCTTFIGLTVGSVNNPLSLRAIDINFPNGSFTVRNLIKTIGQYICTSEAMIHNQLSPEINNHQVSCQEHKVRASNGYELLVWLQRELNAVSKSFKNKDGESPRILVQLTNGSLEIFATNTTNKSVSNVEDEQIIRLTAVNSAMFNGSACTVEAPWNPSIQPGSLFYMPPTFMNGTMLPNSIASYNYQNDRYLYRVITMNLTFSTCGADNKMTLLALPEQYTTNMAESKEAFTQEEYNTFVAESFENKKDSSITIPGTEQAQEVVKKQDTKDLLKQLLNVPVISQTSLGWTDLKVNSSVSSTSPEYTGDSYSSIAHIFYKKAGIKDLEVDKNDKTKIVTPAVTWPLILVGTYQMTEVKKNHNYFKVNINTPDYLEDKVLLRIPAWRSFDDLACVIDVFYWAYHTYKPSYQGKVDTWLNQWKWLYEYLGGGDIEQ